MLYRICRAILVGFLRVCYRFQVFGAEHLPPTGPVIVVSNHANFIDPIVVGCSLHQRQVCFMAKEELFRIPLFGGLIRRLGAFPVKRGTGDRGAFGPPGPRWRPAKWWGCFPKGRGIGMKNSPPEAGRCAVGGGKRSAGPSDGNNRNPPVKAFPLSPDQSLCGSSD